MDGAPEEYSTKEDKHTKMKQGKKRDTTKQRNADARRARGGALPEAPT